MPADAARPILVAIESVDAASQLQLAAAEAVRRGCGIDLVHAVPLLTDDSADPAAVTRANQTVASVGRAILRAAESELRGLLGPAAAAIRSELFHGDIVPALIAESAESEVVVIQHRFMGSDCVPPAASVAVAVAARSRAPVVAVPKTWRPDLVRRPVVTVGVPNLGAVSGPIVRLAVEWADRSSARVRVLHAANGNELSPEEIWRALEPVRADHPGVPVAVEVSPQPPDDALLATPDTRLFVVGRRHPVTADSSDLGDVPGALLRWSRAPVVVVDPVAEHSPRGAVRPALVGPG